MNTQEVENEFQGDTLYLTFQAIINTFLAKHFTVPDPIAVQPSTEDLATFAIFEEGPVVECMPQDRKDELRAMAQFALRLAKDLQELNRFNEDREKPCWAAGDAATLMKSIRQFEMVDSLQSIMHKPELGTLITEFYDSVHDAEVGLALQAIAMAEYFAIEGQLVDRLRPVFLAEGGLQELSENVGRLEGLLDFSDVLKEFDFKRLHFVCHSSAADDQVEQLVMCERMGVWLTSFASLRSWYLKVKDIATPEQEDERQVNKERAAMVSSLRLSTKALLDAWAGISAQFHEWAIPKVFGPGAPNLGVLFEPSWIDVIAAISGDTVSAVFNIWKGHAEQVEALLNTWIPAGWHLYKDELLSPERKEVVDKLVNNKHYADLMPLSEVLLNSTKCLKSINTDGARSMIEPSVLDSMRSTGLLAVETTTITWALFHLTTFIPQMGDASSRIKKTKEVLESVSESSQNLGKSLMDRANLLSAGKLPVGVGARPDAAAAPGPAAAQDSSPSAPPAQLSSRRQRRR